MHDTALKSGEAFAAMYGGPGKLVVDIGGRNVNGSLRAAFEQLGMRFVCVDLEPHSSVDVVVKPGERLPFATGSVDLVVSTSCFEHDPCFWLTFKEMARMVKPDGFIYVNAPTRGPYHCYPGDNWRFYSDAGQALAYWSGVQVAGEPLYPVKVVETFNVEGCHFNDFVCVWARVPAEKKETRITVHPSLLTNTGQLEKAINSKGYATRKKC